MVSVTVLAAILGVVPSALAQSAGKFSASTFADIQKYTAFAAAAYADRCPTPPRGATVVKFFNNTATDTQAYLFQLGAEKILSFRGSSSPKDLDTDFNFTLTGSQLPGVNCPSCLVHQGFQYSLNAILSDVQSAVAGSSSLTITGHSLGGALASLAAAVLKPNKVFTFGEPRNGNAAWGSFVESVVPAANYYRVTHYNDGVPQIPPTSLGYAHHGTEYFESKQTGNSAASTQRCASSNGAENTSCNQAQDFGKTPINGAHIQYTGLIVASSLNNPGCGFTNPA